MLSERKVKLTLHLPKLESCVQFESDIYTTTSRSRILSITKAHKSEKRILHKHTVTQMNTSNQLHLYTPKYESVQAKRLKNIPYQLKYFIPNLPNKNFKSSHLMNKKLLETPQNIIQNKDKWQLNKYKTRMNNAFSLSQSKRMQNKHLKTEQQEEQNEIRRQNQNYIENEKVKRLNKQRIETQKIIDQYTSQFNSSIKLNHIE
ncbi:unnamed protein product [Paramecium pentaurelia]|uniref:Uncharacterized protein n=1 Tax=Paramecium pentaurelia TaxID=43138 RepID=A0A8S1SF74_9CILI|nr:unnamed protein product [Paramecium pentaurelia]